MPVNVWEKLAAENANYYILTDNVDYSSREGEEYFVNSGKNFSYHTLELAGNYINNYNQALEIGCGIGRLTIPHSEQFNEIHGVDISVSMLNRLNQIAIENNISNITTYLPDDAWKDNDNFYDYAFSFLVFQHIEELEVIRGYIKTIYRVLAPGGIAFLHFDTRKQSVLNNIRKFIPDFILPKVHRRGIRRIRRNAENLRIYFHDCNFSILLEQSPESDKHFFILKK